MIFETLNGTMHATCTHETALEHGRKRAVSRQRRQRVRLCETFGRYCWVIEDAD